MPNHRLYPFINQLTVNGRARFTQQKPVYVRIFSSGWQLDLWVQNLAFVYRASERGWGGDVRDISETELEGLMDIYG